MTMKEFTNEVAKEITEIMGEDFNVEAREVVKNNDQALNAITITERGSNIAPTIYVDQYVDNFGYDTRKVALEIINTYSHIDDAPEIDTDMFTRYDNAKDKIFLQLVSANQNLDDFPHKTVFGDLAVIARIFVDTGNDGVSSVKVTNSILSGFGVTFDDIYDIAMENTERLFPSSLKGMAETMLEIMGDELPEFIVQDMLNDEKMYVLTNTQKVFGAISLLYKGMLGMLTERFGKFAVLPSSVHEVLIVPLTDDMDETELTQMVQEVNDTQVSEEEVLSNHAYVFRNGLYVM